MSAPGFREVVTTICEKDSRYRPEAYAFVREALDFTAKRLKKPDRGPERHVSGRELLDGIRRLVLREFGPMGQTVLKHWGVQATSDFGEIVFNLVEAGVLGKTDEDTRADFANGYEFSEAFARPFQPSTSTALHGGRHRKARSKRGPTVEEGTEDR